jgi:hypothetical protein
MAVQSAYFRSPAGYGQPFCPEGAQRKLTGTSEQKAPNRAGRYQPT